MSGLVLVFAGNIHVTKKTYVEEMVCETSSLVQTGQPYSRRCRKFNHHVGCRAHWLQSSMQYPEGIRRRRVRSRNRVRCAPKKSASSFENNFAIQRTCVQGTFSWWCPHLDTSRHIIGAVDDVLACWFPSADTFYMQDTEFLWQR